MSDAQKLSESIYEYKKANKSLDDKLKEAAVNARQSRLDKEAESNRQS